MRTSDRVVPPRACAAFVLIVLWTLTPTAPARAKTTQDAATRGTAAQSLTPEELAKQRGAPAIRQSEAAPLSGTNGGGGCAYVPLTSGVVQALSATTNLSFAQG